MYMSGAAEEPVSVGVAELRQNLSVYLRRIAQGERLIVTDRNRPVAELVPVSHAPSAVDRLIAEGRATPARRSRRFSPLVIEGLAETAFSDAVIELRGDR
jgi:prevent-host-death family protein